MLLVACYFARCARRDAGVRIRPPEALGAPTWKAAYDSFFEALGDGRTLQQFRHSLHDARFNFGVQLDNAGSDVTKGPGGSPPCSTHSRGMGRPRGRRARAARTRLPGRQVAEPPTMICRCGKRSSQCERPGSRSPSVRAVDLPRDGVEVKAGADAERGRAQPGRPLLERLDLPLPSVGPRSVHRSSLPDVVNRVIITKENNISLIYHI